MKKKYKLGQKKFINNSSLPLYRIIALRDFADVKAGDIGGWLS